MDRPSQMRHSRNHRATRGGDFEMNSTVKFLVNAAVLTAIAGTNAMAQTNGASLSLRSELANHPYFEVRVYDYAHLSQKKLQAAENEAQRIFSNAGVNVRWVECPTSQEAAEAAPACNLTPNATSTTLIIEQTAAASTSQPASVVGQADEHGSHRAYVYYGRIDQMAGGNMAPADILMGRVITSVVGRGLLGEHATYGILSESWGYKQTNLIAGSDVQFTRAEAQQLLSLAEKNERPAQESSTTANGQ
jgi:hypothetical protein